MREPKQPLTPTPKPSYFTREERVRLTFLLRDVFPPPMKNALGLKIDGFEWDFLYELLQRNLGRMAIGNGYDAVTALQDFVTERATEDELLTMLSLMPVSYIKAFNHVRANPYEEPSRAKVTQIVSAVNSFLEKIGSPARFTGSFEFVRDGYTDASPRAVKALPGKEQLAQDLKTLGTGNSPVAVIFVDLDNFKAVNDTNGHAAGNQCLETIVAVIGSVIKQKGKLYRYGGDEFVVLLPNSIAGEAVATAERLRATVQKADAGKGISVTASVGVAASDIPGVAIQELVDAADAAMYSVKKMMKNQVAVWNEHIPKSRG